MNLTTQVLKMADVQYNNHCTSIHQINANVLTGKMFSLNSNKSLLPERSKTIFICPSLQGRVFYQHQPSNSATPQRNLKF